jgi:hypothetical protein
LRAYVVEHLGDADAVMALDETACPRGFHGHVSRKASIPSAFSASICFAALRVRHRRAHREL